MTNESTPIACNLNALTKSEQHREQELLREHVTTVQEVRELPDGYAYRLPADVDLFRRTAEFITLEHRCVRS